MASSPRKRPRLLAVWNELQRDDSLELNELSEEDFVKLALLLDRASDDQNDDFDEAELAQLIEEEPELLAHIDRHLKAIAATNSLGPIDDAFIETQQNKILEFGTPQVVFDVLLKEDYLEYGRRRPSRIVRSLEVVRSANEPQRILQHQQRLKSFGLKITIELQADQLFALTLEFEFVDPRFSRGEITVVLINTSGPGETEKTLGDKVATFPKLSAGSYVVKVRVDQNDIDAFRIEVKADDETSPQT